MTKQGFIKTEEEIAIIREGGERLAQILCAVRDATKPGVTTGDLDRLAEKMMREGGDEPAFLHYTPEGMDIPYPGSLCVSVNDEIVHGIGSERVLQEGDIIGIDTGIKHKGLFTDSALTVPVGNIDEASKKLIAVTEGALRAGIAVARSGNTVGDIGHAIEKHVKEQGFVVVEELGGHGVGYHQHEDPHVANYGDRGQGMRLKPGMVLALEPIVNAGTRYIKLMSDGYTYVTKDHKRSAHFEHTILITNGDAEIITKRAS
ncbi:type I methionyl aminopeptidase [Candidatus Nomurabacteria bacterium CG1_02_43_90]|uniref:Methionine aminopeptidase n=1 Tax=Candidatus Nomurabacteria bacterium CG1_02_43_90 TaxID=1805281 RepID=A0A1J4V508_9BACT|nr:MAG: type I methionyl aminopeptidase [Candidatus Nomurabacteria bacterium CG1_02_43_90]